MREGAEPHSAILPGVQALELVVQDREQFGDRSPAESSLPTVTFLGAPDAALPSEVDATSFEVASRTPSALDALEARELGSAIERAIAALRPEYRSCIIMRHVEGRSYEEIASTLDLPLGTVKTYIHRARHELQKHSKKPLSERETYVSA